MTAIPQELRVIYRGTRPGDIHFILHSWLKSNRGQKWFIDAQTYYAAQQRLIGALADRASMVVACDGTQEDFVFGYLCGEMDVDANSLILHYMYVKHPYRLMGIGKAMLKHLGWNTRTQVTATHWTHTASLLKKKYPATFNEYPLMLGNQDV